MKPFYITTTLPYVNAEPHIGFAMELIRADIVARARKLAGHEVFFNTGTDEHGAKIHRNAVARGVDPQVYVDEYATKFKELIPLLGIMPEVNFVRTTDAHHVAAAQEFWKLVDKNGFIYKKNYSIKYCVGCELEKTESELVEGRCPLHPLQELELIHEENYFFKFSTFQKQLLDLYKQNFVLPESRLNEIRAFVERGLDDFSISRLKEKMPWGIAVPGDDAHVMYVWFDALVNYISAVGWPDDMVNGKKVTGAFKKWCIETGGMVQYCGKDNLRQQAAMWQAMLMAASLPASQTIIIDGFITGEGGVKMSKSIGNVVSPVDIVKEYGIDALRYFVVRELQPFEDSPFSPDKFKEAYNASLANGLGNLVSRVMKMAEANGISLPKDAPLNFPQEYGEGLAKYNLKISLDAIWHIIAESDKLIQLKQPFKLLKSENEKEKLEGKLCIEKLLIDINMVGVALQPFLPTTAEVILKCVKANKMPAQALFFEEIKNHSIGVVLDACNAR